MTQKEADFDLLQRVKTHIRRGTYFLAHHAIERKAERAINLPDILFALEFGKREKNKDTFESKGKRGNMRLEARRRAELI